jgi:hypothetical protein
MQRAHKTALSKNRRHDREAVAFIASQFSAEELLDLQARASATLYQLACERAELKKLREANRLRGKRRQ